MGMRSKGLALLSFVIGIFLVFFTTGWVIEQPSWYRYIGRAIIIAGTIFSAISILYLFAIKEKKYQGPIFAGVFGFVVFLLLELSFMFVPISHGGGDMLCAHTWFFYNWEWNSLGYRSQEWSEEDVSGKIKIGIIGDSFVAGHGVSDKQNRFSNLLQKKLGDEYFVFNLGKNGNDTQEEWE